MQILNLRLPCSEQCKSPPLRLLSLRGPIGDNNYSFLLNTQKNHMSCQRLPLNNSRMSSSSNSPSSWGGSTHPPRHWPLLHWHPITTVPPHSRHCSQYALEERGETLYVCRDGGQLPSLPVVFSSPIGRMTTMLTRSQTALRDSYPDSHAF